MQELDDIDFGPDNFQQVSEPILCTFDSDLQVGQEKQRKQIFALLQRLQKKTRTQRAQLQTEASTSAQSPQSSQAMSAKKVGKQPMSSLVMTPKQPTQSESAITQQIGSIATTCESSATEPDYLGLYQMYEESAVQTFSSRVQQTAASTSGFVGVTATGQMDMFEEEADISDNDIEEDTGMLKRRRTRDTQSTITSMQDKKKSKAMILKQIQDKLKK